MDAESLAGDLQRHAYDLELDWIGFCAVGTLDDAPTEGRPRRYLADAQSAISIGYRLNDAPIQNLPTTRSAYMLEHDYANRHLDRASQRVARFLSERGYDAAGFDPGAGFYHEAGKAPLRFAGDISHKHTAVACGLGTFGLNNLVLSPRWGPRIRLATVLTSAELSPSIANQGNTCLAGECLRCVEICPVGALEGWEGQYDPKQGWAMDKRRCYDYIFGTLKGQRCGLCIMACPVGLGLKNT
jgi:epoxyqueuosine reductase QueG